MRYRLLQSDFGCLALIDADRRLRSAWVLGPDDVPLRGASHDPTMHADVAAALEDYFARRPYDFSAVPLPEGGPFYRRCWEACRSIPPGQTRSYGELAEMAGAGRSAARAAGQAMRHNPLPVIIPCHRVVASDGSLHGFAGKQAADGPEMRLKRALLEHEGALAPPLLSNA